MFAVVRTGIAATYATSVVVQLAHSIGFWQTQAGADVPFLVLGFFSYFTMESGIAAAVVLGVGAVLLLTSVRPPRWFPAARGLIVVYTATKAIAYNLLLRPMEVDDGSVVPWSNEWLHLWGPVLLLLDWLLAPISVGSPIVFAFRS